MEEVERVTHLQRVNTEGEAEQRESAASKADEERGKQRCAFMVVWLVGKRGESL